MHRNLIYGLILFLLSVCEISVFAGGLGTTGADFLRLGIGTRATAMGGNFVGLADDVSALYWNPAGLATQHHRQLDSMQLNYVADITYQYIGGVYPLGPDTTVGAYYSSLGTPMDNVTTYTQHGGTGAKFNSAASVINLSYATKLDHNRYVGVSVKNISERLADNSASGFSFDAGMQIKEFFSPQMSLGLVVQNFGLGSLRSNEPIGTNLRAGLGYQLNEQLTVVADVNRPLEGDMIFGVGAEYWMNPALALRGGFNTLTGIAMGVGVRWSSLYFNYAFVPYGDLGDSHRFAVSYDFDWSADQQAQLEVPSEVENKPAVINSIEAEQKFIKEDTLFDEIKKDEITPALSNGDLISELPGWDEAEDILTANDTTEIDWIEP
jgi:hypothetical protein